MDKILPAHFQMLFYRIDDGLESLRVVHREVGEDLAVETDVLLCEFTHELRIVHTVLAGSCVDTGNPQGTESAFLGFAIAVCVGETFFVGILGYGPDVLPCKEVTAGFF